MEAVQGCIRWGGGGAVWLVISYLNQRICAEWGACKSDFFQATNGVKRGSIISQYCSQFMLMS